MMMKNVKKIVVVVGCQRSGTTLTGQILGAHPNALMIDEPDKLYEWFEAYSNDAPDSRKLLRKMLRQANKKYKPKYCRLEKKHQGGLRILPEVTHLVLKAPNLTYAYDVLSKLGLPVVVVFLVRDPRAVVASLSRLKYIQMVEAQASIIEKYPDLASEFSEELQQMKADNVSETVKRAHIWRIKSGLLEKFFDCGLPTMLIKYEDLVADTRSTCNRMIEHIGLPYDLQLLAHESVYRGFGPGLTDRTRAVDSISIGSWMTRLSSDQEETVLKVASPKLEYFGYDANLTSRQLLPGFDIDESVLRSPVIMTGRGGSGTRLLSQAVAEGNPFLGNRLNRSGDSLEWVDLIYEIAIATLRRDYGKRKLPADAAEEWDQFLLRTARSTLGKENWDGNSPWGWKLPETMLVLPELFNTFTNAKLVHLVRHPVSSSLRRSHITSREDNPVGRQVLQAAYIAAGLNPAQRHEDEPYMHNALTWRFQVGNVVRFAREQLSTANYVMLRYEDFCTRPAETQRTLLDFIGVPNATPAGLEIDGMRTGDFEPSDTRVDEVWNLCKEVATEIGYEPFVK